MVFPGRFVGEEKGGTVYTMTKKFERASGTAAEYEP